jgi:hypothetical protein
VDNRINEIRRQIRSLRVSMLEAEAIMREQINQDRDCSFVAGDILKMRTVMSVLVRERESLGDREPILVKSFLVPRRPPSIAALGSPAPVHAGGVALPACPGNWPWIGTRKRPRAIASC